MSEKLSDRPLKHRWWCIHKECKHYTSLRCSHPDIQKATGKKMLRIKSLKCCPVFVSIDAALGIT